MKNLGLKIVVLFMFFIATFSCSKVECVDIETVLAKLSLSDKGREFIKADKPFVEAIIKQQEGNVDIVAEKTFEILKEFYSNVEEFEKAATLGNMKKARGIQIKLKETYKKYLPEVAKQKEAEANKQR